MRPLQVSWLGRVPYADGIQRQLEAEAAVKAGADDRLLLLEHPPVITLGRGADRSHVLRPEGTDVVETSRGGDVTWHGPGQLVGYPVINLKPDRCDVGKYLRDLERVLIEVLSEYGIEAGRKPGLTGVWVGDRKIAALGVHMSRWVTTHGFALSVSPDLGGFSQIVPCGITEFGVTSMQALLGQATPSLRDVAATSARAFARVFDRTPDALPLGGGRLLSNGTSQGDNA